MTPSTGEHGPSMTLFQRRALARQVILDEAAALGQMAENLPNTFDDAVELLLNCQGCVIVTGIGKAGWIGQKISASFASTGTRSHFLHPSEAIHGDLGRIGPTDVVLLLSNSGETEEVTRLTPILQREAVPAIAVTANADSSLARNAQVVLNYGQVGEACPHGLAPTTSTTVMLALGDALALVTSQARQFGPMDFAAFHPGGSLGKRLSHVTDIMRPLEECRVASENETVRTIYIQAAGPARRSGAILLTGDNGVLRGIFTDSDLARLLERQQDGSLDQPIAQVMTRSPVTIPDSAPTTTAVDLLAARNLSELPVVDHLHRPVGMIDITDVIGLLPAQHQQASPLRLTG